MYIHGQICIESETIPQPPIHIRTFLHYGRQYCLHPSIPFAFPSHCDKGVIFQNKIKKSSTKPTHSPDNRQPPRAQTTNSPHLSRKYGPIFTLRFGSQLVAVVSSASTVEECFTKNDVVFANRFPSFKTKYLGYNHTFILASSYGDHWRNLRRISTLDIFSTHRLNSFLGIRKDETTRLLRKLAAGIYY